MFERISIDQGGSFKQVYFGNATGRLRDGVIQRRGASGN